jgi:hypothetical protein
VSLLALASQLIRECFDGLVVLWMRVKLKPDKAGFGAALPLRGLALGWSLGGHGASDPNTLLLA